MAKKKKTKKYVKIPKNPHVLSRTGYDKLNVSTSKHRTASRKAARDRGA